MSELSLTLKPDYFAALMEKMLCTWFRWRPDGALECKSKCKRYIVVRPDGEKWLETAVDGSGSCLSNETKSTIRKWRSKKATNFRRHAGGRISISGQDYVFFLGRDGLKEPIAYQSTYERKDCVVMANMNLAASLPDEFWLQQKLKKSVAMKKLVKAFDKHSRDDDPSEFERRIGVAMCSVLRLKFVSCAEQKDFDPLSQAQSNIEDYIGAVLLLGGHAVSLSHFFSTKLYDSQENYVLVKTQRNFDLINKGKEFSKVDSQFLYKRDLSRVDKGSATQQQHCPQRNHELQVRQGNITSYRRSQRSANNQQGNQDHRQHLYTHRASCGRRKQEENRFQIKNQESGQALRHNCPVRPYNNSWPHTTQPQLHHPMGPALRHESLPNNTNSGYPRTINNRESNQVQRHYCPVQPYSDGWRHTNQPQPHHSVAHPLRHGAPPNFRHGHPLSTAGSLQPLAPLHFNRGPYPMSTFTTMHQNGLQYLRTAGPLPVLSQPHQGPPPCLHDSEPHLLTQARNVPPFQRPGSAPPQQTHYARPSRRQGTAPPIRSRPYNAPAPPRQGAAPPLRTQPRNAPPLHFQGAPPPPPPPPPQPNCARPRHAAPPSYHLPP